MEGCKSSESTRWLLSPSVNAEGWPPARSAAWSLHRVHPQSQPGAAVHCLWSLWCPMTWPWCQKNHHQLVYILEFCSVPCQEVVLRHQGLTVSHAQLQQSWSMTSSQAGRDIWSPCASAQPQLLLPSNTTKEAGSTECTRTQIPWRPVPGTSSQLTSPLASL